jgi:hypothetical protein
MSCPAKARLAVLVAALAGGACGPRVDCEKLCARTLACEVTFAAPDDPDGAKLRSGERTDEEACALGCAESTYVTVDGARCVDGVDTSDPATCQPEVLDCLGYAQRSAE